MCTLNPTCGHFTFNSYSYDCRNFDGDGGTCTLSIDGCRDCIAGGRDCDATDMCLMPGMCVGELVRAVVVDNVQECRAHCVETEGCENYTVKDKIVCMLTKNCVNGVDPYCGGGIK